MKGFTRWVHDTYGSLSRRLGMKLPICQDVPAFVKTVDLRPAGVAHLDAALESAFHGYQDTTVPYEWPEWKCYEIPNALLAGDQGFVYLEDGRFFAPSLYPNEARAHKYKLRRPIRALARKVKGTVFHLTGANHENRGHFMLDHLPRLIAAREYLKEVGDYQILLTGHHIRWQREYLKMIGFPEARIVPCDAGSLQVERLLFTRFGSFFSSLAPPPVLAQQRDAAGVYAGVEESAPMDGPPVFLSRKDAPDRRLLNEARIFEIAKSMLPGLVDFKLTGTPLPEQIWLFRRTPLFIGGLGQASCNIALSKGATIVNLKFGAPPEHPSGSIGTLIAAASGNRGLTLYSGTPTGENLDWSYDEALFTEHLSRFLELERAAGRIYS